MREPGTPPTGIPLQGLPEPVARGLSDFLNSAQTAFGPDLRSAVLYGSAAEGRMRATSDVNLMLVLLAFDTAKANSLRDPLIAAHAAINLKVMFVLEPELQPAAEAFAQKFADILRRRRVLIGPDPLGSVVVPRGALLGRLQQVLLNLTLRLREAYLSHGNRPEQLARIISDAAGPLRTSAASLLELEGGPALHPKEALERFVATLHDRDFAAVLKSISKARENGILDADEADATLMSVIELAERIRARAAAIR